MMHSLFAADILVKAIERRQARPVPEHRTTAAVAAGARPALALTPAPVAPVHARLHWRHLLAERRVPA